MGREEGRGRDVDLLALLVSIVVSWVETGRDQCFPSYPDKDRHAQHAEKTRGSNNPVMPFGGSASGYNSTCSMHHDAAEPSSSCAILDRYSQTL